MRLGALLVGLLLTAPLLLQAMALLFGFGSERRPKHARAVGVLALVIGGLIVVNLVLWATDLLIISPDLGLAMMQGPMHCALRGMIIGYAVAVALIAKSGRAVRNQTEKSWGLWLTMCLTATVASLVSVLPVGLPLTPSLQVWAYDLYAPTLPVFTLGCLLDWLLAVLDVTRHRVRLACVFWACTIISGCAVLLSTVQTSSLVLMAREGMPSSPFGTLLSWSLHAQWCYALAVCGVCAVIFTLPALGNKAKRDPAPTVIGTWSGIALLSTMFCIVALSIDLFYVQWLSPLLNLICAALVAILWVELISGGAFLDAGASIFALLWSDSSAVRCAWEKTLSRGTELRKKLEKATTAVLFAGTGPVWTAFRIYLLVALLAATSEYGRRGHVIIHAFDDYTADGHSGQQFAESIRVELARLIETARAGWLLDPGNVASKGPDGLKEFAVWQVQTERGGAAVENDTVELGGAKIPLHWINASVFGLGRWLFWGREVRGSLYPSGSGFGASAFADQGASWRAEGEDGLEALAAHLAFEIANDEPGWSQMGMTTHWAAYQDYADALELERSGELVDGSDPELRRQQVVTLLRRAVAADPAFSLARHRLALALQGQQEFADAMTQLRLAVAATPNLGIARSALASLLLWEVEYDRPWTLEPASTASYGAEAQQLWEGLLAQPRFSRSPSAWLYAHLGLCTKGLHHANEPGVLGSPTSGADQRANAIVSFYHCAVGARSLTDISVRQAEGSLHEQEANALNTMGVLTTWIGRDIDSSVERHELGCSAYSFDLGADGDKTDKPFVSQPSAGHAAARTFFRAAVEQQPDDPVLRCNLAESELALDNAHPMERLQHEPRTMQLLCVQLAHRVSGWTRRPYYKAALDRCEAALQLDPYHIDTLNVAAYGLHVWQTKLRGQPSELPSEDLKLRAERHARDAYRLARGKRSDSELSLVESTLGELLFSAGRPHEAIPFLRAALGHAKSSYWASEIHHDLAQAHVCAAKEDLDLSRAQKCDDPSRYTEQQFERIREREREHEDQPYTETQSDPQRNELDQNTLLSRCVSLPNEDHSTVEHVVRADQRPTDWDQWRLGRFELTLPGPSRYGQRPSHTEPSRSSVIPHRALAERLDVPTAGGATGSSHGQPRL